MAKTLVLIILSMALPALAAGGHHHGEAHLDEATLKTIMFQAINVGLVLAGLVYYLRKPVRDYFAQKHAAFVGAAEKAMAAQKKAEEEHQKVQAALSKLEATHQDSIARAHAEAVDLRNSLLAEAKELTKRIQNEAVATTEIEIEKAKRELRQQMIEEAIKVAQAQIKGVLSNEDHARLNKEFLKNFEVVQS